MTNPSPSDSPPERDDGCICDSNNYHHTVECYTKTGVEPDETVYRLGREAICEINAIEGALRDTGISGIYTDFTGPADAITQICHCGETMRLADDGWHCDQPDCSNFA
jgi:hypothetical protein